MTNKKIFLHFFNKLLLSETPSAQHRRLLSASHAHRALHSDFVVVCQQLKLLGASERELTAP